MRGLRLPRAATTGRVRDALGAVVNQDDWWIHFRRQPQNAAVVNELFPSGLGTNSWDDITTDIAALSRELDWNGKGLKHDLAQQVAERDQLRELWQMARDEFNQHHAAFLPIFQMWADFNGDAIENDMDPWDMPGFAELSSQYQRANHRQDRAQEDMIAYRNQYNQANVKMHRTELKIARAERRIRAYRNIVDTPPGLVPKDPLASLMMSYG